MALWYAARAFGLVSLALLTAVMVLGLLVAGRPRRSYVVTAVHRSLALTAVAFVALHVASTVIDGYVPIGWLDVVVPFGSAYRPLWLGLGTVAIDLVLALAVTSLLRTRLSPRVWRAVHWLAYVCWPVALVHGIGIGTDSALVVGLTIACVAAVAAALVARFGLLRRRALVEGGAR